MTPMTRAVVLSLLLGGAALRAQGEIIDRVLAVVSGAIITQSDVDAAIALGLVETSGAPDPRRAALDRLIARELTLREVRRYLPPEPAEDAILGRVEEAGRRHPSPEAFEALLSRVGMDSSRLRERIRDDLRIRSYLDERFASVAQATGEEIAAYYFSHLPEFTRGGRLVPFDQAVGEIRQRLEAGRREAVIDEWLAGLRRRGDVMELYQPGE